MLRDKGPAQHLCNEASSTRSFMIPPRAVRSIFEAASSSESEDEEEYVFKELVALNVMGMIDRCIGGKKCVMFRPCFCGVYKCDFCLSRFVASRLPQ